MHHSYQYGGSAASPNITGLTSNPVTKDILASLKD